MATSPRMPLLVQKFAGDDDQIQTTPRNETFKTIVDRFNKLEEVSKAIEEVGVERCEIIFGIDYSEYNIDHGKNTYEGHNLHHDSKVNPYHEIICTLGETIEKIDHDGKIPVYGFGADSDEQVFPLKKEGECEGFSEVDDVYRAVSPSIKRGKSASFAPVIDKAVEIVKETKRYHILVIASTGQLTDAEEQACIQSIVAASEYPLSIVVIGVGDGPWNVMKDFDDKLSQRTFDNFQFVDFYQVKTGARNPMPAVALAALMEIPDQYLFIKENGLIEKLS